MAIEAVAVRKGVKIRPGRDDSPPDVMTGRLPVFGHAYSGSMVGIGIDEQDAAIFERTADRGGGSTVKFVLAVFETAHGAAAHLCANRQIVLGPCQKRPSRAALFRCQRHAAPDGSRNPKINMAHFG